MAALKTHATSSKKIDRLRDYSTDDQRWEAVVSRDSAAEGKFFYSVKTTGVYCRPGCPARRPRRENVQFHTTILAAQRAGFRACQRCRPDSQSQSQRHSTVVSQACRLIEQFEERLSLEELANAVGMSPHHFHRVFKSQTGITPKAYAMGLRSERVQRELAQGERVTDAIYAAGFSSSGRFYETATTTLGMPAKSLIAGGAGTTIRFGIGECWLGSILVAATDRGVCAVLLGDDPEALINDLQDRFPKSDLIGGDRAFEAWVATVIGFVEDPMLGLDLPLDIRGTAFQQRVWQVLRQVPAGSTTSYSQLAEEIGKPSAVRAVASAVAANPIAVAIPCHRVIRTDGSLAGYRWGVDRKAKLLEREEQKSIEGRR